MSIASEITRLQGAKADIKSAIEAKGVTVPSNAKLDTYDTYIDEISSGPPTKLTDLNTNITEYFDYVDNLGGSFGSLNSTETTLYTPNASYDRYVIIKNGVYYYAYWLRSGVNLITNSENKYGPLTYIRNTSNNTYSYASISTADCYYYPKGSTRISSVNTILNKLKDANAVTSDYQKSDVTMRAGSVYAGNLGVINTENDNPLQVKTISSNETITSIT